MAVSAEQHQSNVAFIINEFQTLYGRQPTQFEINHVAEALENGSYTRERWVAESQPGGDANATVIRIYTQVVGKPPTNQAGIDFYAERLRNGNMTQDQVRAEMSAATAANRKAMGYSPDGPTAADEDAKAYLTGQLNSWGLGDLSSMAWDEIQKGYGNERIVQDIRNSPQYAARFPAMKARQQQGLPPIDESTYIAWEGQYRNAMRAYGIPSQFWDNKDDYTALIAGDVSPTEIQERLQNGYARVEQADPAIRQVFADYFGPAGDAALATYYLDPTKGTQLLEQQTEEARIGGFASLYGMHLGLDRAQQIYGFGRTGEQVQQAGAQLGILSPVFQETVSEGTDLTKEQQGLNAELGLDATSQAEITRRLRERTAATSGGGGAAVSSKGVLAGTAE